MWELCAILRWVGFSFFRCHENFGGCRFAKGGVKSPLALLSF